LNDPADTPVRVLVVSDLHLRTIGCEFPVDRLPVEDHDLVISLGDVIDDNRDHAPSSETGDAYERRGRAFFETLAERGRPALAVPGNHDPVDCTRRLTEGLDDASLLHRTAIDTATLPTVDTGNERPNLSIVGHGCEQFDVQSTFLAPGYPGVPGAADEDHASRAERVAACIERAAGHYLTGVATGIEIAESLGVDDTEAVLSALERLKRRYDRFVASVREVSGPPLVATHVTPYGTPFDFHHRTDGTVHFGSLAAKLALYETGPVGWLSGHTHQSGLTAIETPRGYTYALNPGAYDGTAGEGGATSLTVDATGTFRTESVKLG
jgi:Icc-related predicted phosphoesterase